MSKQYKEVTTVDAKLYTSSRISRVSISGVQQLWKNQNNRECTRGKQCSVALVCIFSLYEGSGTTPVLSVANQKGQT